MKTYSKKITAFIDEKNNLHYFQFNTTKQPYTNLDIVRVMADNGCDLAAKKLKKLEQLTSRERSESGIYWNLKKSHEQEWVNAQSQLTGEVPLKKVIVEYTATPDRDTIARRNAFNLAANLWEKNPSTCVKVPYTSQQLYITRNIITL